MLMELVALMMMMVVVNANGVRERESNGVASFAYLIVSPLII